MLAREGTGRREGDSLVRESQKSLEGPLSHSSSEQSQQPIVARRSLANAVESGYAPALMTALVALGPAMMGGEGTHGELRSGLVIYALPMSLVGSKAFAVTLKPLRDWWTRALSADSMPVIPILMMAWLLQAWTLMAACVTRLVSQAATEVMASTGVSGAVGATVGHLRADLALWLTTWPVLITMLLTVGCLLFCRGVLRAGYRT